MPTDSLDSIYSLPIHSRQEEILAAVDQNQITIITAETGAGKSTQVPQYLAEHGYTKVIVTQPRILAARNLCARVRQEYSWRRGTDSTALVGYRTAHEQDDSPDNVILYCTDGLQLVRELTGSGIDNKQVLVLDEIHEWNENMEVLIAWAKKRCAEEPDFKLVLMSATIEAASLAKYFGAPAPISVEGRSFPVAFKQSRDLLFSIDEQLARPGANILVFLPGKAEIEQVAEVVETMGARVPIIPLHSQLELEDQQKAFQKYPGGKIILSTNIAQTSITIDDIDVVIDSGLERRIEVRNGVEGLFVSEISQADCLQRAGRAGRTKEGTYILAKFDQMPCAPIEARPEYGIPEIMRKHIDRLVLRLANAGIDIEMLEFFHSPTRTTIKQAKKTLATLGALDQGNVTDIGRAMERFPVESSYGRMLVESQKYSTSVQAKLALIISIQEVGGIVKSGPRYTGWRKFTTQTKSDLLAQYDVYLALPSIPEQEHEDIGIITKNIEKTREVSERILRDLGLSETPLTKVDISEEEPLLKCITAGLLHQIWLLEKNGEAIHIATKKKREASSTSVVKHASVVVGMPFDLEVSTYSGLETLHLVNDLTAVNPLWLEELAPKQFKVHPGKAYFEPHFGTLATKMKLQFRGQSIETSGTPLLERSSQMEKQFVSLYASWLNQQLETERMSLRGIAARKIPSVPLKVIEEKVRRVAGGAISTAELSKQDRIQLFSLSRLATWHGEDALRAHRAPIDHDRQPRFGHRDWKQPHKRHKDRWRHDRD